MNLTRAMALKVTNKVYDGPDFYHVWKGSYAM